MLLTIVSLATSSALSSQFWKAKRRWPVCILGVRADEGFEREVRGG